MAWSIAIAITINDITTGRALMFLLISQHLR